MEQVLVAGEEDSLGEVEAEEGAQIGAAGQVG